MAQAATTRKRSGELLKLEEFQSVDDLTLILEKERIFEAQLIKVNQVHEDVLETMFLETDGISKPVKISTLLHANFWGELITLLQEFWMYSHGIMQT